MVIADDISLAKISSRTGDEEGIGHGFGDAVSGNVDDDLVRSGGYFDDDPRDISRRVRRDISVSSVHDKDERGGKTWPPKVYGTTKT